MTQRVDGQRMFLIWKRAGEGTQVRPDPQRLEGVAVDLDQIPGDGQTAPESASQPAAGATATGAPAGPVDS